MVINLGSNTAEAINFTLPELTKRYCDKPSLCNCIGREKIDNLRKKFNFHQPGEESNEPLPHPSDGEKKFAKSQYKQFLMFPQILKTAAPPIPFHLIRQQPGICVATWPGAYHMVINAGSNTAEAINFTDFEFTERFCNKPSRCNCIQRKAIDLTRSKNVEDENFASLNFNRTSDYS
ncbi:hypothetical protein DAPPUDRAFT_320406 [Daphnia pulex]|uniref:JmjC domain-containing protein n=1 Tax=Daphnia pulex TaxID=6669 RepID=E9GPS1_DAPPU|nr:hypothetical protein DAPPUDRAFT_320406 [Daphnia pulex]|eukprot:EFX78540.1 hypothetical protein DAPPUDRAFT_320406 [Daphnia pulex]